MLVIFGGGSGDPFNEVMTFVRYSL